MSSNNTKRESKRDSSVPTKTPIYSLPYTIYMYKEELRKTNNEFTRMSKVKLHLTDSLIINTIRNLSKYDVVEILNVNQQMIFKKRLCRKLHKIRKLEKLGLTDIDPNQISDDI